MIFRCFLFASFLFCFLAGLYGFIFETNYVEIRHFEIGDQPLGRVLKGKVAVHITDLHISKIGKREKRILKILNDVKPDFIFLTGDYVDWNGDYDVALTFLSKLNAKIGVWAVMGDYDYSNSRKSCLFCHEPESREPSRRHSVHFIRNRMEKVTAQEGYFWIGGVDLEGADQVTSFDQFFKGKEKDPVIILSHNPLTFDRIASNLNFLMLAGDTHGGQILLPSFLYKLLGYKKNARFNQGFFKKKNKRMYVSRGIGTSHIPIRLFRRPEVAVIHFTSGTDRGKAPKQVF